MKRAPLVVLVLGAVFAYGFVRDAIVADKLRSAVRTARKVIPL